MKNKAKEIITAAVIMIILWSLCAVCSGELVLADSVRIDVIPENAQKVLTSVFPYFFIVAAVALIVVSTVKKKKAFAIAASVMTVVPFISLGMEFLISKIFPNGSILLVFFMFPASPAATFINMLV